MSRFSKFKKLAKWGIGLTGGYVAVNWFLEDTNNAWGASKREINPLNVRQKRPIPTRFTQIDSLESEVFDVLVVGGGAVGCGCALDAVTRGLKTALVEENDFSSGTSSRSTKLLHGGVRYLQKALLQLDFEQYRLVKEALHERHNLLEIAPHLSYPLPIMLPVYKLWQIPYYWFGIKLYDVVAGSKCLRPSYFLTKQRALELFPMLRKDKLVGAIVYYDGQHNDSRMNLSLAITATRFGATVANHVKVIELRKERDMDGVASITGATLRDELTGREFNIKAKSVINATGAFTDQVRKMDNPNIQEICAPSAGTHIVLPGYYAPTNMGLLDPSSSDGRVLFFLPWMGHTIAGTTDSPCGVTHNPQPTEKDIQFILHEVKHYLTPDLEVRRGDVMSSWSGIRPLVFNPNKEDTQSLARNHVVEVSPTGLVTIAGGKWTTYRAMARDAVDAAVKSSKLTQKSESQTDGLFLEGAHFWSPTMFIHLVQDIGMETEVAKHLANTYGDRAFSVAKMSSLTGKRHPIVGKRLHQEFPYIDAEVRYAIREYAVTAVDVIARRLRLAFLNIQAAEECLPEIIDIMGEELKWSKAEKAKQYEDAMEFLRNEMGLNINLATRENIEYELSKEEIEIYTKKFQYLDTEKKGYISLVDIRKGLMRQGETISGDTLHDILREIDTNRNGQVELDEYLALISALKSGKIVNSRFARTLEMEEERLRKQRRTVTVERSGGGV